MEKYLTVGTKEINTDLFMPIQNSAKTIKPTGGLWLTKYNENFPNYNEWVDYLTSHPHLLFFKGNDFFVKPASLVILKENTKIYYLNDLESLCYLKKYYPFNNFFSYAKLAQDYDGIFVDYFALSLIDSNNWQSFGVKTLILFNLDAINYYYPAEVNIEENPNYYEAFYQINIDNTPKKVTYSNYYQLICQISQYLKKKYPNVNLQNKQELIIDALKDHQIEPNEETIKKLVRGISIQL